MFDDRGDARSPVLVEGFQELGTVDDLVAFARSSLVDLVIFALPITAEQRILTMLRKLCVLPVDIRLAAHANPCAFGRDPIRTSAAFRCSTSSTGRSPTGTS